MKSKIIDRGIISVKEFEKRFSMGKSKRMLLPFWGTPLKDFAPGSALRKATSRHWIPTVYRKGHVDGKSIDLGTEVLVFSPIYEGDGDSSIRFAVVRLDEHARGDIFGIAYDLVKQIVKKEKRPYFPSIYLEAVRYHDCKKDDCDSAISFGFGT